MQARDGLDLLPLRQMVAASGDAARVFAGQALLDRLARPDRFRIAGDGQGALILAASERALAEARVLLRQAYGEQVTFGATSVHSYLDATTRRRMVPVIFVRIDAARPHLRELMQILQARGAQLKEVDAQRDRAVLRTELELSRALGLEHQVLALTDGSAHFLSWLLRYQPAADGAGTAPALQLRNLDPQNWENA